MWDYNLHTLGTKPLNNKIPGSFQDSTFYPLAMQPGK